MHFKKGVNFFDTAEIYPVYPKKKLQVNLKRL